MSKTNKKITSMSNRKNKNALLLEYVAPTICFGSLLKKDKDFLERTGICPSSLPMEIYAIDCNCLNRARHGIGMRNIHGGVEFISLKEMRKPATIHQKGIIVLRQGDSTAKECCLFENFMDYLAYLTLLEEGKMALPRNCDCILLNHPHNLSHFLVESEDYETVNLLLTNTLVGRVIAKTVMDRSADVVDWSESYVHFQGLRSYAYYNHTKNSKKQ